MTMPSKPNEKRTAPTRARRRLMVRFGANAPERAAFTKNLSDTGAFLQTNNVFAPGATIQLQIHFPDRVYSHWGRVVWAKKAPPQLAHLVECGMGVCFIDPSSDWLEYFSEWAKKNKAV
jgi:Tfp pilus assembly protein PilZ